MPETIYRVGIDMNVVGDGAARLGRAGGQVRETAERAHGSFGKLGSEWGRQTAALERFSPRLVETAGGFGRAGEAVSGLLGGMTALGVGTLGAVAAVGAAGLAMGELGSVAIEVNREVAGATRSIGAAISAAYQFGKAGTDTGRNYAESMHFARGIVGQLQDRQMELGESMPVLAEGYLKMIPAIEKAGGGTEQVLALTERTTLAAKALGMSSQDAYFQIQSFMETGMARGEFLKQLGLAGEKFGEMAAPQRLKIVMDKMGELERAGREAAQATGTVWSMMWEDIRDEAGKSAKAMSDVHAQSVRDMAEGWKANRDTAKATFEAIGAAGALGMDVIRVNVSALGDLLNSMLKGLPGMQERIERIKAERVFERMTTEIEGGKLGAVQAAVRFGEEPTEGYIPQFVRDSASFRKEIARMQSKLMATIPKEVPTPKVEQTFTGPIHIRQDFRDQDPDRVLPTVQRDLAKLAERRRQSPFAPAFGF